MNYQTTFYKNKAEQLQQQIIILENRLNQLNEAQRMAIAPGRTADMEDAAAADAAFSMFRDAKEKVDAANTDDAMTRAKNLEARFSERLAQQGVADPAKIANPDRRYDDVEGVRVRRAAEQGKAASSAAMKAITNLGSQQPDTGFDFTKAGRGVADDPNSEYSKKQRSGGFDVSTAGNATAAAAKNLLDKMNAKAAQSSAPTGAGSTVSDAVNTVLTMGKGGSKSTGGTSSAPASNEVKATSNPNVSTYDVTRVTAPQKAEPGVIQVNATDDFAKRQTEEKLGLTTPPSVNTKTAKNPNSKSVGREVVDRALNMTKPGLMSPDILLPGVGIAKEVIKNFDKPMDANTSILAAPLRADFWKTLFGMPTEKPYNTTTRPGSAIPKK